MSAVAKIIQPGDERFRRRETRAMQCFAVLMLLVALLMVGIVVAMVIALATDSMPSIRQFGFGFLTGPGMEPDQG